MRTLVRLRTASLWSCCAGLTLMLAGGLTPTAWAQSGPPVGGNSSVAPAPPPGAGLPSSLPPATVLPPWMPPGTVLPPALPPSEVLPPSLPPPPFYVEPGAPGTAPQPVPENTPPVTVSPAPTVPPAPTAPRAPLRRVPHGGGITVGWTYTPSNNLPLSSTSNVYTPSGINLDARFGWQIGGIDAGWPSWVGFMAGFFYYVGDQGINNSLGIDYGIFLKHALFPGKRIRLFIGYGLGVAQVWVNDLGGHGIGHETRLSAGLDTQLSAKVHFTVEFAYKLIMLPSFAIATEEAANYNFQAVNLLAGLWFGR